MWMLIALAFYMNFYSRGLRKYLVSFSRYISSPSLVYIISIIWSRLYSLARCCIHRRRYYAPRPIRVCCKQVETRALATQYIVSTQSVCRPSSLQTSSPPFHFALSLYTPPVYPFSYSISFWLVHSLTPTPLFPAWPFILIHQQRWLLRVLPSLQASQFSVGLFSPCRAGVFLFVLRTRFYILHFFSLSLLRRYYVHVYIDNCVSVFILSHSLLFFFFFSVIHVCSGWCSCTILTSL